jgi:hypothetical protein
MQNPSLCKANTKSQKTSSRQTGKPNQYLYRQPVFIPHIPVLHKKISQPLPKIKAKVRLHPGCRLPCCLRFQECSWIKWNGLQPRPMSICILGTAISVHPSTLHIHFSPVTSPPLNAMLSAFDNNNYFQPYLAWHTRTQLLSTAHHILAIFSWGKMNNSTNPCPPPLPDSSLRVPRLAT